MYIRLKSLGTANAIRHRLDTNLYDENDNDGDNDDNDGDVIIYMCVCVLQMLIVMH
jgi:hypothetical protein